MRTIHSDEEVIRRAYEAYDDELTDLVPEFVTPEEHVGSDDAEAWAVQIFQFAFALGAVTGDSVARDEDEVGFTEERIEDLIDTTVGVIGELDVYSEDHFRQ